MRRRRRPRAHLPPWSAQTAAVRKPELWRPDAQSARAAVSVQSAPRAGGQALPLQALLLQVPLRRDALVR